jgi:prepilin-type N-terminal cleavage/methylation domain-containing protein
MLKIIKSEKGFTLIEVLMALALLGLIATAFIMAISTATKAIYIADEMTTAESLARSQMEFIKEQQYNMAPHDGETAYDEIPILDNPNYSIWSVDRYGEVVPSATEVIAVPWDNATGQPSPDDVGLQKVTIIVMHHNYEVFTLEDYKVDAGVN